MGKNTIKSFFGNWIVKNLLLAVGAVLVLVFTLSILLGIITRHNKDIVVPDLTNIPLSEAVAHADSLGLYVTVGDSVYIRRMGRGFVYTQNPPVGSKVKTGRKIMVVINSVAPKKVKMPNLVGFSLRQAKTELSTRGLRIESLQYVDDIATDNVLRQLYKGEEIEPGTPVETLSPITLELGFNPADAETIVPDVIGLKYLRAVDAVLDNSLNIGGLSFDKSVKTYTDSLEAFVWKQRPLSDSLSIQKGEPVWLYFTKDSSKLPAKPDVESE